MATFEVEYYEPDDIPHIVTITPVYEGVDNITDMHFASLIAGSIINRIVERVSNYNGWSRNRILLRVSGILNATNYTNNKTYDEFSTLGDINTETVLSIFEKVSQSNDTVQIYDLTWSFTIDVNSLMVGAGGRFNPPSWAGKKKFRETWRDYTYNGVAINCAAFAIARYLAPNGNIDTIVRKAFYLQTELTWDSTVDYDELKNFVLKYPKYKLNVLSPPNQKPTHTYIGKDYVFEGRSYIIYLYYYQNHRLKVKHYALCDSPLDSFRYRSHASWCYFCDMVFKDSLGHHCEQTCAPKISAVPYKKCEHCNLYEYPDHLCFYKKCSTCQSFSKVNVNHRCPLMFKEQTNTENYSFIVYDLESRFELVKSVRKVITSFKLDVNGFYLVGDSEDVAFYDHDINKHIPNLVCAKNMLTGEKWTWFGDDCLVEFLQFCFSYNNGENILLAHNASGYDSRLIFDASRNFIEDKSYSAIMRGSKFMQMNIGTLIFRDIMLQIPGSVKNLAKDFGCAHQKGDFPFLFNKVENYSYSGPIPDISYFSLANCRNQKQRDDMIKWHSEFTGEWNFMEQLVSYCQNDVEVSCEIAKSYHDIWMEKGISPWYKPTGAGVVHQYMGLQAFKQLVETQDPPDVSDKEEYSDWLQRMVDDRWWAVLKPYEHFFSHKALRGGRTEVKRPYFKLTDEEYAAGKRILYVDVCSMYPYQQIAHEFPVGTPTVHVWDKKYLPCKVHYNSITCSTCPEVVRHDSSITSVFHRNQPNNVNNWFGIVCVTLKPPKKMLHPVLISWNEKASKCVSTLNDEDHIEIFIGTASLHTCLANGYVLEKIHCFHEYSKGNFWREPTLKLYLDKMMNSRPAPDFEEREAFAEKWGSKYGNWFKDLIKKSWDHWGKFNAKKFVSKIIINSVWGKHAQRVIMPKTFIYDFKTDIEDIRMYFKNCSSGGREHKNAQPLNGTRIMYTAVDIDANPDLHGQYLPAGLMVPEYGRLQLWEEMNKLGDRVLYCDTDSIVYVSEPGKYDVKLGDMVGDWELEDVCTLHDGIREFVAWGPKTYGIKCGDGYTSVKAKGVSLNRATENLFNFQVMKEGALEFLEYGEMKSSFIPQTNFTWSVDSGMRTMLNLKEICIKKKELKGTLKNGFMYPFGYDFE
jgi:hypothetical protein